MSAPDLAREIVALINPPITFEAAQAELSAIEQELRRRRWAIDPIAWAEERLGSELWSKQREILRAIILHSHTAVISAHDVGKSYIVATIACWWIDTHAPGTAFVVTSAPTAAQVRAILWHEMNRIHGSAKLSGRMNQTEWLLVNPVSRKEEQVAIGRKPDEYTPTAFQGLHRPFMLYIFDEACGIPPSLWVAAESLIANDQSKAVAIGNPDDPQTEFGTICKPNSGWHVIQISAFDTPNFTGESVSAALKAKLIGPRYIERMRKRWAPGWTWTADGARLLPPDGVDVTKVNPYFQSKVLGQFPASSSPDALIPLAWVRAAQQRNLETRATEAPHVLGIDVGGGSDSSTGCERRGPVFRIRWEDYDPDTMHTTGNIVDALRTTYATCAKVDYIGIGRGVVDRGRELLLNFQPINVGVSADIEEKDETLGEGFLNLRAQLWWAVRTAFERGEIDLDLDDEQLAAELVEIRYERMSNGKIKIESKKDMLRRGVASPNRADALMLTFAPDVVEDDNVVKGAVW